MVMLFSNGSKSEKNGSESPIRETTTASFSEDVIKASEKTPVIVDFYTPDCRPCQQLTPLLEKAVRATGGAVKLVKMNVQKYSEIAVQLRVQTVPTVYAFKDGQPVDAFTGAQPEKAVKEFVQRLCGETTSPEEAALEEARLLLESGDATSACALYKKLLSVMGERADVHAGYIRALLKANRVDKASAHLEGLSENLKNSTEITAVKNALDLALESAPEESPETLKNRLTEVPEDHFTRFDLAMALYSEGDIEPAIAQLVEIVRRDHNWEDEKARKQLLKIFDTLGDGDPRTLKGRQLLSAALFS